MGVARRARSRRATRRSGWRSTPRRWWVGRGLRGRARPHRRQEQPRHGDARDRRDLDRDHELLPRRWSPGIERVLGLGSVLGTYAVMGATLTISRSWRTPLQLTATTTLDETREEAWFV